MTEKIWFTSDQHYYHDNIIKYCGRPFSEASEMNRVMVERHNSVVGPKDKVYHIGDFAFRIEEKAIRALARSLNGRHTIILGNHDHDKSLPKVLFDWNVHYRIFETKIDDVQVTMCHYPMMSWQASFHGSFQLHGHTHGMIPFDPMVRRLDVGVDCWNFTPVSWETVKAKLLAVPTPKEQKGDERNDSSY